MKKISLNIHIDHSLEQLKVFIENLLATDQLFILTDSNTRKHCLPILYSISNDLTNATIIEIPAGEKNKNSQSLFYIIEKLAAAQADRNAFLINLGGGVVCDIGAFVATIYKRGINYIHVPTSLLAQLDASIGGKNGIDYEGHKNFLGTISFPQHVFISKQFLNTLPETELRSGMTEALKHGLIADEAYWNKIKTNPLLDLDLLLEKSIFIKSTIVENDPYEKNVRKKLNAGHTIGHAIESWKLEKGTPVMHGEAVAAGLVMECHISLKLGYLPPKEFTEIERIIFSLFSKIDFNSSHFDDIIKWMLHDKKNSDQKISFSLIRKIGEVSINDHCENTFILSALEYYSKK